jgi:hypothetical protein
MTFAVVLAVTLVAFSASAAGQEVSEDPTVFPDGPYRDEVFYFCTACHSSRLIRTQRMTRERWDDTLHWMTERHDMPLLTGEERQRFLDYLTHAFGPATTVPPARRPFLTQPARKNPFTN